MGSARKQPILGTVAGLVLGFFVGLLASPGKSDPYHSFQRVWETVLSVSAGGAVVGFLLGCFANRWIKGRMRYLAIGVLAGVIAGLLGGVVLSEFLCERAIEVAGYDRDDPFFGKMTGGVRTSYRAVGLCFGPMIGGLVGAGVGLSFDSKHRLHGQSSET